MTDEESVAYLDMNAAAIMCGQVEWNMVTLVKAAEVAVGLRDKGLGDWNIARARFEQATARYYRVLNGIPEPPVTDATVGHGLDAAPIQRDE